MMQAIATTPNAPEIPQSEFSKTWPRLSVVSTAVQEQISAVTISGRMSRATMRATRLPVDCAVASSMTAHCAAKDSSAMVATVRPTMTLDNAMSNRASRGMSYTGSTDRNAQPNTYTAD